MRDAGIALSFVCIDTLVRLSAQQEKLTPKP